MASKPKIPPPPPPPAERPIRKEAAKPEDIVLGGEDELLPESKRVRGKRALTRPTSGLSL